MENSKIAFIDVETTGTDAKINGLIQLGMILYNPHTRCTEEINHHIKPLPGDMVEPKALEVNGHTTEKLKSFPPADQVKHDVLAILDERVDKFNKTDKFFFVGYNAGFDYQFCRTWWGKCGDNYFGSYFHYPPIDVAALLAVHHPQVWAQLPNRKLVSVYKHFFPARAEAFEKEAHDAMADIRATVELFELAINVSILN